MEGSTTDDVNTLSTFGKQATWLITVLVGDSQSNNWLVQNYTNHLLNSLCYITYDKIVLSV